MDLDRRWVRIAILVAAYIAYTVFHLLAGPFVGRAAGMVVALPVLLGVAWFGYPGALVAPFVAIPVNMAANVISGTSGAWDPARAVVAVVASILVFGAAVAREWIMRGRRSSELLRLAFDAAEDGLWDYRLTDGTTYHSPRWYTMLGYDPPQDHSYDRFPELLHPDDRERILEEGARNIDAGARQFNHTFRMRHADGHWVWILSRGKAIEFDAAGRATRLVGVHSDISELKRAEEDLVFLAYHDQLTGLPNRRALLERAPRIFEQASRAGDHNACAVMILDIDGFKTVNDSLGHDYGDDLLRMAAGRLWGALRASDSVFRLGGDEFAVVLSGLRSRDDAGQVADSLIAKLRAPFDLTVAEVTVTASVGIASVGDEDGRTISDLLRGADSALAAAKRDRDTFRYHTTAMQDAASRRLAEVERLRRSQDGEGLTVVYQPVVDRRGVCVAVEALLRRVNADGTLGAPTFVTIAEEVGLIVPIGAWVLREAAAEAATWGGRPTPPSLHVNLSPRQLRDPRLVGEVTRTLAQSGLPAGRLTLELTEASELAEHGIGVRQLRELAEIGITCAVDDFGTGYSSLAYLRDLPISELKIDRRFVAGLPNDRGDEAIVHATVTMARGLGLRTVAEGVETPEQSRRVRELGCDRQQGYLWAVPMLPEELAVWFASRGVV